MVGGLSLLFSMYPFISCLDLQIIVKLYSPIKVRNITANNCVIPPTPPDMIKFQSLPDYIHVLILVIKSGAASPEDFPSKDFLLLHNPILPRAYSKRSRVVSLRLHSRLKRWMSCIIESKKYLKYI